MKICGTSAKKDVGLVRIYADFSGMDRRAASDAAVIELGPGLSLRVDLNVQALAGLACDVLIARLLSLPRHHQVVLHGKHSIHAVGADAGQVLVSLAVHNSFQRHVSMVHNDANRAV